jgi:hypothetical protein
MGPEHILGTCEAFFFYNKPTKCTSYKTGAGESEEDCSNIQVCKINLIRENLLSACQIRISLLVTVPEMLLLYSQIQQLYTIPHPIS